MRKKVLTIIVIAIVSIQIGCMALFVKSCVCFTKDGYRDMAWSSFDGVYDVLHYYNRLPQQDIDKFKLYKEREDSVYYRFTWYRMSDTDDSIFITGSIEKRFPHSIRVTSSISTDFLRMYKQRNGIEPGDRNSDGSDVKWRRTLNNLFDTAVVNSDNVIDYIRLLPSDSMNWTVGKGKIAEYISKGYYTIESNKSEPKVIGFYNYVGIKNTTKEKYRISEVAVIPLENNVIGLSLDTPEYIPGDFDRDKIYEEKVEEY